MEFGRFDLTLTRQPTTNNPPAQPSLSTPANGATNVSLAPTLTTGPFYDPDEGDAHRQTEWLISKSDDFLSTVFNQTTAARLNSLEVPWHTLDENTTYYWKVRFYDQENAASAWSETRSFVTGAGKDSNGNGLPDDQEDNDLDQDNDGIKDYLQPHIKSLKVEGKGSVGVSRKDDTTILDIKSLESIDPASISSVFRPHNMPLDLVVANLSVLKPIDGCEAKLYFSEDIPEGAQWFSHNPIHGWRDYTDSVTFSGNTAIIRLRDWGYGDSDGIPNGTIVDPVGYGITPIIKGTIVDALNNQPVRKGFISVSSESIPALSDGAFWSPIVMGTHQVTASAAGYASETKTLSFNEPAVVVSQDFHLTPIPDVDLADVIIILQVLAGLRPKALPAASDFNQDNKSGLEDVIYILQKAARLRND